ncbi:reverse transcriptase domain-containing protein, partial [Mycobacterium kansasii]
MFVDDIIMMGDDENEINSIKQRLTIEFEVIDLGSLRYFLGIEVAKSSRGIFLSQRKYVINL